MGYAFACVEGTLCGVVSKGAKGTPKPVLGVLPFETNPQLGVPMMVGSSFGWVKTEAKRKPTTQMGFPCILRSTHTHFGQPLVFLLPLSFLALSLSLFFFVSLRRISNCPLRGDVSGARDARASQPKTGVGFRIRGSRTSSSPTCSTWDSTRSAWLSAFRISGRGAVAQSC